ncbi:MAG: hypothetical protein LQ348_005916 [Seirophora lacunosa]|nr:MAG: hypothetical protein LQ344_002459 [Seirophora lacunosa]KAI4176971.1 MAG: hypothetical protein LQ348_005916 [Seirophora lacunosa]
MSAFASVEAGVRMQQIRILVVFVLFVAAVCPADATQELLCWKRKEPTSTDFTPTVFKQCLNAIADQVIVDAKMARVPQLFTRTPGKGFRVPHAWASGNCVIGIDVHSEGDEDTLRLYDIAVQATLLNIGCVARPPHYGGTILVGSQGVMNVTIMGWPFPEARNPGRGLDLERVAVADTS